MRWLIVLVCALLGCQLASAKEPAPKVPAAKVPAPKVPAPNAPALPGDSLYQLAEPWTNQDKVKQPLAHWRGGPVALAMIFTRCQYSCPLIIQDLERLDAGLTAEERAKMRIILVSLDPAHDTPEVLKAFAAKRGIDLKRWTLLHGPEPQVRALSVALSMRYKATGKGEFSHGSGLTLLDGEGRIIYQGKDRAAAIKAVRGAP